MIWPCNVLELLARGLSWHLRLPPRPLRSAASVDFNATVNSRGACPRHLRLPAVNERAEIVDEDDPTSESAVEDGRPSGLAARSGCGCPRRLGVGLNIAGNRWDLLEVPARTM
jgi:hypothetical protein